MNKIKFRYALALFLCLTSGIVHSGEKALTNTWNSPHVVLRCTNVNDVQWIRGFWAERFTVCHKSMIPNMWQLLRDPQISHAYDNLLIAADLKAGRHRGPKWLDGDFYKWLEAAAFVYGITRDKALERQMNKIIQVIGKTQREDGYIHSPVVIAQRQGDSQADEFRNRLDFENLRPIRSLRNVRVTKTDDQGYALPIFVIIWVVGL